LEVVFWDFKKQGVPAAELATWAHAIGWEPLINRKGTTWRKLDAANQQSVVDAASAMDLMQSQPSVIKRPVVCWPDGSVSVGFDADFWAKRIAGKA
jgi:arsenate reductase-like glutaredoxin family protein